MLAVAVCAVLAGARSFAAIGEWALDLGTDQLDRLGLDQAPVESTLRKLFGRLDAGALDAAPAVFAWCRVRHVEGRQVIAIDGKTLRGARTRNGAATTPAPHLVSGLDHDTGVVLGQHAVGVRSNEIPAVRDLLATFDPADLHGCVITVDAMHTRTDTAVAVLAAGADYVFTVKHNQPKFLSRLKELPRTDVPVASRSITRGHGRRTTRTIKVVDAPAWTGFAGAVQVAQLRRTVTRVGKKGVEVVYLITSAPRHQAPPAVLAAWVRSHWAIENKLHRVPDVTYDEDRSQVRVGATPPVMATLRNTTISILGLNGAHNIATALRRHARDPKAAITCALTC
jgi:predicted transposase YbfD/YdcC